MDQVLFTQKLRNQGPSRSLTYESILTVMSVQRLYRYSGGVKEGEMGLHLAAAFRWAVA